MSEQLSAREEYINGLRAFADWLAANPDVPVPRNTIRAQYSLLDRDFGTDEEKAAEFIRIAGLPALAGAKVSAEDGSASLEITVGSVGFTVYLMTIAANLRYDTESAARDTIRYANPLPAPIPAGGAA